MPATITLHIDPWWVGHAGKPDLVVVDENLPSSVAFHQDVDYERAVVGPGIGFLRMETAVWVGIGAPKVITITIEPEVPQ